MSGEIAEFVQTCKGCQLRKPEKIGDRAPITPIVRPELPFEIVNIDVIGPIQPPSGRGHKYVLCMMDQHTRWPEAVPLRSLTAKNACDSLLQIFSRTGIPSVIASDQGTNFKSALTQEFTKRIGSSPRFSCPGYPASNGLVERWNKVLKDMIHHVIREDPRSWDRQLPFLLFAYREVPNTTTGVSPFRLLYGREARGPLAILKSSWAGEIHLPTNISQSAADYLQEMKINMEKAAESASLTAAQKQKLMEITSTRDSSNTIYARWTGPGEIIQHHPPHSYKVKLPDGTVRHVHVNKIRKYHPRKLAVGVIFEGDHEFGEIHPTPNLSRSTSERVLHEINLNHLKETVRIYRIPESLKIKVDEQIEELLRLDLIEESDAEIAYPIVCVNKKDGTLRLYVDFRALNSESVSDDFPMEDAVELIHSIGRANIITTLDLLKGYWAIPMAEDSKNLTSFKTHRQQYRFKVMSFGLKNASATFQREMNKAISCYREFSRAYIDDIAIFSKNWEEHLLHLDTILTKLSELNFTVNLKKCAFGKTQIKYLGHIIGSVEAPSLYSPVPDKPYTIHSDASQIGIAACLSQKCGDKCYPIAYASQKLSKTQQSWSTIEREAFAIVWSLKSLNPEAMNLNVLEEDKNYIISVLHDLNVGGDQIISIPRLITFLDLPCKIYTNSFKFQDKNLPIPAISVLFEETVERELQKFFIIATDASKNHQITSIAGISKKSSFAYRINHYNSIFTAETLAICQALDDLVEFNVNLFVLSDSLSVLQNFSIKSHKVIP
ncbi:hypothetical protein TNCV_1536771 [Trichonephila clavipes]|nr:hypothetical protein TNCV_1536771 [Trichonephila clavipes]